MSYTFARVGAAIQMRVEDVYVQRRRTWVRLHEKGGKRHELPCHHKLDEYLHAYLEKTGWAKEPKGFLFRTVDWVSGEPTAKALSQADAYRLTVSVWMWPISPLLEGIRALSGEKIQWYLASELRDRIRDSKVRVAVLDKLARKQYEVEPRQFEGRLLHQLPPIRTVFGDAYAELYLGEPNETARVALTRVGTRVIEDLSTLPGLEHAPWVSRYLQGLIDVPFLNLTPGTRNGIIQDERYAGFVDALKSLEAHVQSLIEEQQRAEEEQASQQSLKAIQKAFHEAMLALPREEYDWFDVPGRARQEGGGASTSHGLPAGAAWEEMLQGVSKAQPSDAPQRQFFDYAGPLFGARSLATPRGRGSAVRLGTDGRRRLPAGCHRPGSRVPSAGSTRSGAIESHRVPARNHHCGRGAHHGHRQSRKRYKPDRCEYAGVTGYTFERAAGDLWRCRFDAERNIIVVNSGHRDFVFATRNRALQLRYLVRLYVKELMFKNFAGLPADQLLERMIELSLYAEEKLKSG